MLTSLYTWARKLHRYLALTTTALLFFMAGSGLMLKYPSKFGFFDLVQVRVLHGGLSIFFAIAIIAMSLTGLMMYFGPALIKRSRKQPTVPTQQPQ